MVYYGYELLTAISFLKFLIKHVKYTFTYKHFMIGK